MEHRRGLKHNTDALSRRPCLADDCKHCHRLETKEGLQREDEQGEYFTVELQAFLRERLELGVRRS